MECGRGASDPTSQVKALPGEPHTEIWCLVEGESDIHSRLDVSELQKRV